MTYRVGLVLKGKVRNDVVGLKCDKGTVSLLKFFGVPVAKDVKKLVGKTLGFQTSP